MIWARWVGSWTSIPAGMSLASGTAPSAVTIVGHCTESGSVGSIQGSVGRDIEVGDAVAPTLIDVGERPRAALRSKSSDRLVCAGTSLGQQWCPRAATATVRPHGSPRRDPLSPVGWFPGAADPVRHGVPARRAGAVTGTGAVSMPGSRCALARVRGIDRGLGTIISWVNFHDSAAGPAVHAVCRGDIDVRVRQSTAVVGPLATHGRTALVEPGEDHAPRSPCPAGGDIAQRTGWSGAASPRTTNDGPWPAAAKWAVDQVSPQNGWPVSDGLDGEDEQARARGLRRDRRGEHVTTVPPAMPVLCSRCLRSNQPAGCAGVPSRVARPRRR